MAFHSPGAAKAQRPTTVAWKKTPLYQRYGPVESTDSSPTCCCCCCSVMERCLMASAMLEVWSLSDNFKERQDSKQPAGSRWLSKRNERKCEDICKFSDKAV